MTRQKHTEHPLLDALATILRRARTSLYQPFEEKKPTAPAPATLQLVPTPPAAATPAVISPIRTKREAVPCVATPRRMAKVIPFPFPADPPDVKPVSRPRSNVLPRTPFGPHKVPGLSVVLSPQTGLR